MRPAHALRIAGFLIACAIVAAAPSWISDFRASQAAFVGLYFVAVVGLDVLVGYSGQISLGHGAFMTVGGYTTAILMAHHGVQDWQTIPVAALAAGLAGIAFGIPALRLHGLYLALATFGVAVSLPSILKKWSSLTGGSTGINLFGVPTQTGHGIGTTIAGQAMTQNQWLYALSWGCALLLFVVAWLLLRSRFGRALQAIRDSEVAAASSGLNPGLYKVLAFGVSAAYAGVAGSLFAINVAYVSPDTFQITLSLFLLVGAVVGGLGSLVGAVVGAVLIEFLPFWSQGLSKQAPSVIYGAVIVALMLILPGGLGGLSATVSRLWSRISPSSLRQP
ncbi:MAG: branched-chain amino acid ABC transporter permease [Gaiellaceae bacterium]